MPAKSILEVDVSTAEFTRYKALFDQYTEKLQKHPALWASIAKQHKQLGQQFQHTTEAVEDEHKKLEDLNKVNLENERRLEKSKGLWRDMATSSESFAKNLTSASGFLSKWGGLLFSGVLGGAAFGIDRAVHDASSSRQQAMGLGVSIGELKAFAANFSRVGDTDSLLGAVNTMETDPTKKQGWYALGLGNMSGDTVKDTMTLLDAERRFAQRTPVSMLGMMGEKLSLPSSAEQLRLMRGTGDAEWNKMKQGTLNDINRLNVPGAQSLQDLETQFKRNMGSVWSAFQEQLTRAAPALSALSDSAARAASNFIGTTGNVISGFAKDPLAPIRPEKGSGIDLLLNHFAPWAKQAFGPVGMPASAGTLNIDPTAYKSYLGRLDMTGGLPTGLLEAVKFTESGNSLYPHPSSKGAVGAFQFMPSVSKGSKEDPAFDANSPLQSANAAQYYFMKYMKEFQGDLEKVLAANNWGPAYVAADVAAHGKDWLKFAPKETQDYVRKIEVILHNNTGGSTTVAANQLAH